MYTINNGRFITQRLERGDIFHTNGTEWIVETDETTEQPAICSCTYAVDDLGRHDHLYHQKSQRKLYRASFINTLEFGWGPHPNKQTNEQLLISALTSCLDWMESLRAGGDAGFWEWTPNSEYIKAKHLIQDIV